MFTVVSTYEKLISFKIKILVTFLKLLEKICSNWCVALDSTPLFKKIRDIIDNNDDNGYEMDWSVSLGMLQVAREF